MDRVESAGIFKDVVIYRARTDVPADVVEAMDVAMQIFAREPRMDREKEARLAQLESDRERILAAERDSRLSFERARDEQARMAKLLIECRAQKAQLETTGSAVLDNAVPNPVGGDTCEVDTDVLAEFDAVLHGDATPADREDPTDA